MHLYPADRRARILDLVKKKGSVTVCELSRTFGVSAPTVRRDIRALEEQGLVEGSYGCVVSKTAVSSESSFAVRSETHQREKAIIAELALQMIEEGDCILLDAGTTVATLAQRLAETRKKATVVTTAVNIARILEQNEFFTVVLTGGILRDSTHSLIGELAKRSLDEIHIAKAFISAGGVSRKAGLSNYNILEAEVKRKIVDVAGTVILLADHSKFGKRTTVTFASLEDIDVLVSDDVPEEYASLLRGIGVQVVTPPKE